MHAGKSERRSNLVRVVNIYATPWRFNGKLHKDEGAPPDLGGLDQHYELYKEQLPRLLPVRVLGERLADCDVALARAVANVTVENAKAELYALPSNQVVLAVTMWLANGVLTDERRADPVAEVLEQCIVGDVLLDGDGLAEAVRDLFGQEPAKDCFTEETPGGPLLPERHQLVFVARPDQDQAIPNQRVIDKILYRSTPPYRPEFVDPRLPKQLNSPTEQTPGVDDHVNQLMFLPWRRQSAADAEAAERTPTMPRTLGVVTPYVSLLYGHREYVEASILLSTVHAVGTAARFRHIWREAYEQVLRFREQKQKVVAGQQTRDDLEFLADNLGNLEFDLTFSVEFPLMRIETFQSDLYNAMDLGNQATTLSQMFAQLGGSLRSEITAIEVREGRRAQRRQRWNSIAAGLLSLIGVPVGFVIAFLGVNTTEVPSPEVSMWDAHYATLYLIASLFALTPVYLIAFPYLQDFALKRDDSRTLWWGLATLVGGGAMFLGAMHIDGHDTKLARILDAIGTAVSLFIALVGLTLVALWVWRRVARALAKRRDPETRADRPRGRRFARRPAASQTP